MERVKLLAICRKNCDCCHMVTLTVLGSFNKKGIFVDNIEGDWNVELPPDTKLEFRKFKEGKRYTIDIYDASI